MIDHYIGRAGEDYRWGCAASVDIPDYVYSRVCNAYPDAGTKRPIYAACKIVDT